MQELCDGLFHLPETASLEHYITLAASNDDSSGFTEDQTNKRDHLKAYRRLCEFRESWTRNSTTSLDTRKIHHHIDWKDPAITLPKKRRVHHLPKIEVPTKSA
ncbi:Oidioi.mRNA.OKI2018_I69.chr1.g2107.t1.cds [Oikopleura dioica]|uniref:Oidioi.mRNA.OKI2018_I69.chr1.g2107.t1.cds n=1 Tax=Oikopleura dioica TaxID=34765 RepID=A0ABN7SVC2_OIKDI|nr:Oidioi.mRNA.OKI2018_I69.chr1.g2107.t1.cds [Oikopleura dioica]